VTPLPAAHYLLSDTVDEWARIGARHRLRDEQFLRFLVRWFRPGPILEIGAATGHLSEILLRRGCDVVASDNSIAFVEAIRLRGVPAALVDVTGDIGQQTGRAFANVLAQNVLPLIWRDEAVLRSALATIHRILEPRGRLICISAHARRHQHPENYFTPREQIEIMKTTGLFRLLTAFPHQVIPTGWYKTWNAQLCNFLDFHAAQVFAIRLVWVMEKIN
jgi:SAM-dependent methyltransferase